MTTWVGYYVMVVPLILRHSISCIKSLVTHTVPHQQTSLDYLIVVAVFLDLWVQVWVIHGLLVMYPVKKLIHLLLLRCQAITMEPTQVITLLVMGLLVFLENIYMI